MSPRARIIDRDVEFYEAMVEQHEAAYFRCAVDAEPTHRFLHQQARTAVKALKAYRHALDAYEGATDAS